MDRIETERLVIRRLRADDLDNIHMLMSDPSVAFPAGFRPSSSKEESLVRLSGMIGSFEAWALTVTGSDEAVGWIRLRKDDIRSAPNCYMLGYAIRPDLWCKGYMTEALGKVLEAVFRQRHIGLISARCFPGNTASRKVLAENGFTYEGMLGGMVMSEGAPRDVCVYSMKEYVRGKSDGLDLLPARLESLYVPEEGWLSGLCNAVSEIYYSMDMVNWAGVYLFEEDTLRLGPFIGKPACTVLTLEKGVCAKSARERKTVIVPDVHEFEGHIACDSASRSEIVIPLCRGEELLGVLDIDSPVTGRFSGRDAAVLGKAAATLRDILIQRKEERKNESI